MCLGPNASRLESIRKELPGKEWIRVVPWSPDIEEFLLATVFRDQADRACVVELKVDEDNFLATVYVNDREAAAKIIGREGREVKLAARLVGLEIQVEVAI
jgi:transcription antitermination factor NusA-like protein